MPIYDYHCPACGPFTAFRSMADYAKPAGCDSCGADAPRAILSAPAIAAMDPDLRRGLAINERSRHEPRRSSRSHAPGCGCCTPSSKTRQAAKSFVGRRPWMISH